MGCTKTNEAVFNNELLDTVIEHSFDGIYITDGQATTIKVNRSYLTISGLKASEVLGVNMKELVNNGTISASGTLMALDEKRPITIHLLREEILRIRKNHRNQCSMVAEDARTELVLSMIDRVAPLDTTVILFGETGVGKEVFAKYIYQHSARKDKPFIKVNCGAIPANLVESELFGYEKGAFTGADKNGKMGLFELANTGTIFLDEVGELPLDMQVKLLRVLQEQEFERIGGRKPVKVDVRVLAATNRDLEEMVKQKTFRQDLYYRLMIFPVHIPPLRERPDDILPLAQSFLQALNRKYDFKKYLSPLSAKMMQDYNWPGNIRELRNIIERAVIISNEDEIGPDALHLFPVKERPETKSRVLDPVKDLKTAMEELELEYINHAYEKYGNVREAAESLGMTPSTFVRKRQKYTKGAD